MTKANWKKILARGYQIGLGIATAGVVFLAGALIVDFNTAFTVFHEIFFTNDLWLFDPAEDYMIRMLPEGFSMIWHCALGNLHYQYADLSGSQCVSRQTGQER